MRNWCRWRPLHGLASGHRDIRLWLNWKLSPRWLAFTVLENVTWDVEGELSLTVLIGYGTACYSSDIPVKVCPLVGSWHSCHGDQLLSSWTEGLPHRRTFRSGTGNQAWEVIGFSAEAIAIAHEMDVISPSSCLLIICLCTKVNYAASFNYLCKGSPIYYESCVRHTWSNSWD